MVIAVSRTDSDGVGPRYVGFVILTINTNSWWSELLLGECIGQVDLAFTPSSNPE